MQFESLKVFCDLAESESFSKAARINGVTQSAVSQTVSALEKQFKSLLVERSKKNFRLTAEGDVVYDYAKRILQGYGAIQSKLQELKHEIAGEVRVAAVYSIGLHDLPPYVKRFLKDHPTVKLHIQLRREDKAHEDVISNLVDVGLVAYPTHDPQVDVVLLRKDPLVLACHPLHPLAKLKMIKIKQLGGQKFVSFEPDMPTRKAVDRILKDQGAKVEHVLEFDNIETLKRAVENGAGVAILGEETIRQEVAHHTLAAVRLEGNPMRQLGAIYKKGKVLSPAMKVFIALLKEDL
ncbi:MAG TPA: LysR family transcriptional regulator [Verrucomicrobiae bacterium]